MSKPAPSARTKRSRSVTKPSTTPARPAPAPAAAASADQRHALIARCAYFRAEARGFSGGDPVVDWLASEREVDALLSGGDAPRGARKTHEK